MGSPSLACTRSLRKEAMFRKLIVIVLLFQCGSLSNAKAMPEADSAYHAPSYSPPSSSYGAPAERHHGGEVVHFTITIIMMVLLLLNQVTSLVISQVTNQVTILQHIKLQPLLTMLQGQVMMLTIMLLIINSLTKKLTMMMTNTFI